jgi:hypothetical protein
VPESVGLPNRSATEPVTLQADCEAQRKAKCISQRD